MQKAFDIVKQWETNTIPNTQHTDRCMFFTLIVQKYIYHLVEMEPQTHTYMEQKWNNSSVLCSRVTVGCLCLFMKGFEKPKSLVWDGRKSNSCNSAGIQFTVSVTSDLFFKYVCHCQRQCWGSLTRHVLDALSRWAGARSAQNRNQFTRSVTESNAVED